MCSQPRVLLIGDVCLDVTLTQDGTPNKMRLGGIMHAARALWALDVAYDLAYIAPDYLQNKIEEYAALHGATTINQIGLVYDAPNVALIAEPTEAGPQGYEILMRDAYQGSINQNTLMNILSNKEITDILIFPGEYALHTILTSCKFSKAKVHIDIAHGVKNITTLNHLGKKFDTGIISTSSILFTQTYHGSVTDLKQSLLKDCFNVLILKENRGGSRVFRESNTNQSLEIPAQVRPIVHSIGVGDCYNAAYVALVHKYEINIAATYASWIAAEYASTTYPVDFKNQCARVLRLEPLEILELGGVSIPWELRPEINIYIAAPDFDHVDRTVINKVVDCLSYHNFKPRLPIRENGQLQPNSTPIEKQKIYEADIVLLLQCQIVLAIMIYDDPGTIFEVGFAIGRGIPVIIYDPYKKVLNPMLSQSSNLLSSNLDEVIASTFEIASKR